MAHYLITLVVETEEGQGSPRKWDWQGLIDSPLPVSLVACSPLDDEPDEGQVAELHERVCQVHKVLGSLE